MAYEFTNVVFLTVDIEDVEEVATYYNISYTPTFLFQKNSAKI